MSAALLALIVPDVRMKAPIESPSVVQRVLKEGAEHVDT